MDWKMGVVPSCIPSDAEDSLRGWCYAARGAGSLGHAQDSNVDVSTGIGMDSAMVPTSITGMTSKYNKLGVNKRGSGTFQHSILSPRYTVSQYQMK